MNEVVTLPLKFWSDHRNRGCSESAVELKRNKVFVTVRLDTEAWRDIYSDAEYYATFTSTDPEAEADIIAFIPSAKATLKRLQERLGG
jgi:hypothetical protein